MQLRVDCISLGVRSVAASRSFYVDGQGWPVHREVRDEVIFLQANHGLILALWDAGQMQAEAATDPRSGVPSIALLGRRKRRERPAPDCDRERGAPPA